MNMRVVSLIAAGIFALLCVYSAVNVGKYPQPIQGGIMTEYAVKIFYSIPGGLYFIYILIKNWGREIRRG